jgi:hypothetical protein
MKSLGFSAVAAAALVAAIIATPADAANAKRARVVVPQSVQTDNVGSLRYDARGYAYNRVTGQRYHSCVIDEGYGRVTSCDAGGRQ